jgi:4-amino-4-deoxy-L-arabinose transferase-like glycosyltransferase
MNKITDKAKDEKRCPFSHKICAREGLILLIICALAIAIRLVFCLNFVDLNTNYYWEYGEIAKNIIHGKGYSLWYYTGGPVAEYLFNPAVQPHPSAYMPPGYVFYLLLFFTINHALLRNFGILLGHIILSTLAIIITYHFTKKFISSCSALIAAALVAFLPEFIYATASFTPTLFYHATVLLILTLLYNSRNSYSSKMLIGIAVLMSITIYFHPDFALFTVLVFVFLLIHRRIKCFIKIAGVMILLLIPWVIRNYIVFDNHFVPFTTSFGLNFYRGHNPYFIVAWGDETIDRQLKKYQNDKLFEIKMNEIYVSHAFNTIKAQPAKELLNSFVKIFHLWIFNPRDSRTRNLLYVIPWFIVLGLFIFGAAKTCSWQGHYYTYLFLIFTTVIAVVFFVLPRYQTMMKIALIPLAAYGAEKIIEGIAPRLANKGVLKNQREI